MTAQNPKRIGGFTLKKSSNRFIMSQQLNWHNSESTLHNQTDLLARFPKDNPGFVVEDPILEMLTAWKASLQKLKYSQGFINMFDIIERLDL